MNKISAFFAANFGKSHGKAEKSAGSGLAKGAPLIASEPAHGRRGKEGSVTHANKRTVEARPASSGSGARNDRLHQQNNALRKQYLLSTGRDYRSGVKAGDGVLDRLLPHTLRLRQENHRLEQENKYLEHGISVQKDLAVRTVDQHRSGLFAALLQENSTDVAAHSQQFLDALESLNKHQASATQSSSVRSVEHLQAHLKKMDLKDLEALGVAAEKFSRHTRNAVVDNLYATVAAELLVRDDPRAAGYNGLSIDKLFTIKSCVELILANAKERGLGTAPSDKVAGTEFVLGDLEKILLDVSRQLATKIVQDASITPESLHDMPATQVDEVAWAVSFCKGMPASRDAAMASKLQALGDAVDLHLKEAREIQSQVAARIEKAALNELRVLEQRFAAQPGLSRMAREAAQKLVADHIALRQSA